MLSEAVTVRLGKQDINDEFLHINLAADFIQSSFGLSPSTAFPTYPDQSMGAVALLQLSESWRLKAGAWDSFATGGGWGISSNDSVLAVGELERTYALADDTLPGTFALGAVFEPAIEIEGDRISPVQEYYFQIEQLIYREGISDDGVRIPGTGRLRWLLPAFPGPSDYRHVGRYELCRRSSLYGAHPFPGRGCGRRRTGRDGAFPGRDEPRNGVRVLLQGGDHTTRELPARLAVHCFAVGNPP